MIPTVFTTFTKFEAALNIVLYFEAALRILLTVSLLSPTNFAAAIIILSVLLSWSIVLLVACRYRDVFTSFIGTPSRFVNCFT